MPTKPFSNPYMDQFIFGGQMPWPGADQPAPGTVPAQPEGWGPGSQREPPPTGKVDVERQMKYDKYKAELEELIGSEPPKYKEPKLGFWQAFAMSADPSSYERFYKKSTDEYVAALNERSGRINELQALLGLNAPQPLVPKYEGQAMIDPITGEERSPAQYRPQRPEGGHVIPPGGMYVDPSGRILQNPKMPDADNALTGGKIETMAEWLTKRVIDYQMKWELDAKEAAERFGPVSPEQLVQIQISANAAAEAFRKGLEKQFTNEKLRERKAELEAPMPDGSRMPASAVMAQLLQEFPSLAALYDKAMGQPAPGSPEGPGGYLTPGGMVTGHGRHPAYNKKPSILM